MGFDEGFGFIGDMGMEDDSNILNLPLGQSGTFGLPPLSMDSMGMNDFGFDPIPTQSRDYDPSPSRGSLSALPPSDDAMETESVTSRQSPAGIVVLFLFSS